MKRLLSIIGAISLLGTSTTSLVACKDKTHEYTPEELKELKEKNKINTKDKTIRDNLEWIAPQETPFNKVNNKWYYVVWYDQNNFVISKLQNNKNFKPGEIRKIDEVNNLVLNLEYWTAYEKVNLYIHMNNNSYPWEKDSKYFKSVYRWNLDTPEPDLILDKDGNLKVNGE